MGIRTSHIMAAQAGFEPTNTRVKVWCLTAWRLGNINFVLCLLDVCIISHIFNLSRGFLNLFYRLFRLSSLVFIDSISENMSRYLADGKRFERLVDFRPSLVFKTSSLNHSDNHPYLIAVFGGNGKTHY